jgi:hypothetical protein
VISLIVFSQLSIFAYRMSAARGQLIEVPKYVDHWMCGRILDFEVLNYRGARSTPDCNEDLLSPEARKQRRPHDDPRCSMPDSLPQEVHRETHR